VSPTTRLDSHEENTMDSLLITAPILSGKLDTWRRFVAALLGERRSAYRAVMRDTGLTRLRVWHAREPDGSHSAKVLFEGPTPGQFLQRIASAQDDFSTWFRSLLVDAHGLDLSVPPPPPPQLSIDERVSVPVTYSCSRVRIQSPAAWRRVMDELRPLRVEHGQVSEQILQSAEDEHEFTVLIGWQNEERARSYYAHPELRAGVDRAGGVEGRGLTFLMSS
jgi:hypothetical protein